MNKLLEQAYDYAEFEDAHEDLSRFNGSVHVVHGDGSEFRINNAYFEIYKDKFLIVYTEHNGILVWFLNDLHLYKSVCMYWPPDDYPREDDGPPTPSPCYSWAQLREQTRKKYPIITWIVDAITNVVEKFTNNHKK